MVVSQSSASERRSAVDILDEAPGHLIFKTAADVAAYLAEEKGSMGSLTLPTAGVGLHRRQCDHLQRRAH